MCWNKDISLNTFVFSIFVLIFVIYNNKYTIYKDDFFNNKWGYLFLLSFILMQLVEYFIWKNIDNKSVNHFFSTMGVLLLYSQPIFALMLLKNKSLRMKMLLAYLIPATIYLLYLIKSTHFITVVARNGHLKWNWESGKLNTIVKIAFLFFLFFAFIYEKEYFYAFLGFILIVISTIFYQKENTATSMWCWSVNLIMLYLAFKYLFILPYKEHGFCGSHK